MNAVFDVFKQVHHPHWRVMLKDITQHPLDEGRHMLLAHATTTTSKQNLRNWKLPAYVRLNSIAHICKLCEMTREVH